MGDVMHDPLGFTKQTKTLLCGVGANELIKEFQIRNISTDALHKLTKEDFMQLGANEDLAENVVNTLSISKRKNADIKPMPHQRVSDTIKILDLGEKHLALIQAYMAYCRLRLREERINFFVEPNKALSASEILCTAADATLKEINEADRRLKKLRERLKEQRLDVKRPWPRRESNYPYMLLYCITLGSICIATYKLLKTS